MRPRSALSLNVRLFSSIEKQTHAAVVEFAASCKQARPRHSALHNPLSKPHAERPIYPGEVLERIHVLQAEMIGGDIYDNADIAMVKSQARADNAAAGGFKNGNVDGRVF